MSLEALIFDVDGTLADTEEAHRSAFNQAFAQHGLDWHWSKPQYADLLRTTGGKERINAYIDSLALSPEEKSAAAAHVAALHETKTDIYTRTVLAGLVPLRDGVLTLMNAAERAGVRLAIATTTTHRNIDALLSTTLGAGALERFSVVGAGDQVRHKKPAPDIYEYVLRELGSAPENCVAIEDSLNGLTSAKAAGLYTVVTPSYWTSGEDFAAADLVVPSLADPSIGIPELERQLAIRRKLV